jgi:putative ABC transport system permease protein
MTFGHPFRRYWPRIAEEVDAELAFHVEMRTRELVARGTDPAAARRAAVARFGNIQRVSATCRAIGRQRNRIMRRTEYWLELRQDVVFAVRQLLARPGFAALSILTLALGIGATTAIFSTVHAVVLRPLPLPHPERIVAVYEEWRGNPGNVSAGNFTDVQRDARTFNALTAIQYSSFNLAREGAVERVIGARATAGFFNVFGVQPALGRSFTTEEDQPGREQVVVLSHRLWIRRFGGNAAVVGQDVALSGRPYRVIGVMPASFDLTVDAEELWVPVAFTAQRKAIHDEHYLTVYGRLGTGVPREHALDDLTRIAQRLRAQFPKDDQELSFQVIPLMQDFVGDYSTRLYVLLGAVGFVLLIACSNVANLLLARGASRVGEIAVRAALGAGRGRIFRQLLTECLVLAFAAAAAGLAIASWGIRALVAVSPPGVPRLEQTHLDTTVLLFTIGIAVFSALLFGVVPARRSSRADLQAVLKDWGRGAAMGGIRDRLRTALVVGELALALLLLTGASLLIQSSLALQRVPPGFDPHGVLSGRLSLPAHEYESADRIQQTFERIVEEARSIPGVQSAAVTSQVPRAPGGNGNGLIPEGKAIDANNAILARLRMITPGYFEAMRIPIVRGRPLTSQDRRGSLKVMVVSDALARAAFPNEDPIGRRITCCEPSSDGGPDYKTIVGVAGDVRSRGAGEAPSPEFYLPIAQLPPEAWTWIQRTVYVVVRMPMGAEAGGDALRAAVRRVAPDVPLFDVRPMDDRLGASLATARFNTLLLTLLGVIGLVLAAVGVYGVMAYFVSRRTQEIGVRMALGATKRDVILLVVRQSASPLIIGVAAGIGASVALTGVLKAQLFGVTPRDPLTLAAAAVGLGCIALGASLVPAGRAAAVDPTQALRSP